ncbi:MAG: hypothetical protein ACP5FM_12685, partial [Acidithiobacillus sp.]
MLDYAEDDVLKYPVTAGSMVLAVMIGHAWQHGIAGPVLAILLIPLVLMQPTKSARFLVAAAYYLAGSHGIPLASAVFFGPGGHWMEGVALWISSSVLLATGWAFADKPWKAAGVLIFDALIPPLAFFDWMSPLAASGVFFPGWGVLGVVILLVSIPLIPWLFRCKKPAGMGALIALCMLPVTSNLVVHLSLPDPSQFLRNSKGILDTSKYPAIQGINLNLGPSTNNIMTNFARLQTWVATADMHHKPKILLLPETLLTWWPGNAHYIEQHVPAGQTWLIGASIPLKRPGMFADGIEAVTSHSSKM